MTDGAVCPVLLQVALDPVEHDPGDLIAVLFPAHMSLIVTDDVVVLAGRRCGAVRLMDLLVGAR